METNIHEYAQKTRLDFIWHVVTLHHITSQNIHYSHRRWMKNKFHIDAWPQMVASFGWTTSTVNSCHRNSQSEEYSRAVHVKDTIYLYVPQFTLYKEVLNCLCMINSLEFLTFRLFFGLSTHFAVMPWWV